MKRKDFLSSLLLIPAAVVAGVGAKKPDDVSLSTPSATSGRLTKTTMVGKNRTVSVDFNADYLGKTVTVMTTWEAGKTYSTCWTLDKAGPDDCYVAWHPELTGCMAQGRTAGDALKSLESARELYLLNEESYSSGQCSTEIYTMDDAGIKTFVYRAGIPREPKQYSAYLTTSDGERIPASRFNS